jgi:mannose/fructose/N-acetylgalactosamine-specific phosphotransferase system component IIB
VAIVLCRVDERLIHGQVTVAWGGYLHPDRYVVVDDALAVSEWEREIYRLGVPPEAASDFFSVEEARTRLSEWRSSPEKVFLLTRDLDHMCRLASERKLVGERISLGGIYHAPDRQEVLSYLYLSDRDRSRIALLLDEGADVVAQDLPTSPAIAGSSLIDA